MEKLLAALERDLKDEGMDCAIFDIDEASPKSRLLVYLGNDEQGKEKAIEITADEQALPGKFKEYARMEVDESFYCIRIQSIVLSSFQPAQSAQMASVINFLNGMLELPGLWSDEVNHKVFYRNAQLISSQDFRKAVLIGLIGIHRMISDSFSVLLEKIGSGQMTYFEFLEEVVKITA